MHCYALGLWARCINWKSGSVWKNSGIPYCRSVNRTDFGYLKITSLTELIRNGHRKSCAATFRIENPGIANEFSILGVEWMHLQISNEPISGKKLKLQFSVQPHFTEKEKARNKWCHFPNSFCVSFCKLQFQTHLSKVQTWYLLLEALLQLSWRITFCIGEERGIHCWSCPANEVKLRTEI